MTSAGRGSRRRCRPTVSSSAGPRRSRCAKRSRTGPPGTSRSWLRTRKNRRGNAAGPTKSVGPMRSRALLACLAVVAALALPASARAVTNPQIPGLQVALKAHGFYSGPIDGIAGPMTANGVRQFQRRVGIVVDGVAGPITRGKLGRLGRPLFGKRHLLVSGYVGWDVSVLEFFLRRRGFWPGSVDGHFTERTKGAVMRYQRSRHLAVDGVVGPQTLASFGVRRAVPQPTHSTTRRSGKGVRALLTYWARYYGLSPSLVKALAWQESGFQQDVRSSVGARGVMQVRPQTWSYVE